MKKLTITNQDPQTIARLNDVMTQAGQAANEQAARVAFQDHTPRKANNIIRFKFPDWENQTLMISVVPGCKSPATLICLSPMFN